MNRPEPVTGPVFGHAEGPVWIPDEGLHWVDMMAGDVVRLADSEPVRWHVGSVAAVVRSRTSGGLAVVAERELLLANEFGGSTRSLGVVFEDPAMRFNEGACDPVGRFLVGTMAYDQTPGAASVYRFAADGAVEVVWDGVTVSNGLCWNASGGLAYYNDTPTGRIDVFTGDADGNLSDRRPFVVIDPADGSPDGLTVDADGGVWVALWGGHAVRHYAADGSLAQHFELPAPNVTAPTLGPDGRVYITTSQEQTDLDVYPLAGSVFAADAGVGWLPPRPFAG